MKNNQFSINALVDGLKDGGCVFSTNVPGARSQEIFKKLGGTNISINERVSMEVSYGASLAGKRSVVLLKNVGLNVAFDSFVHSVFNGIEAGLVVVVIDDIEVTSSPERQDSRSLRDVFGGLWLEPNSIQNAYDFARDSFSYSEKMDMPVVIRLTNQFFRLTGSHKRSKKVSTYISSKIKRSKYINNWKVRNNRYKKNLLLVDKISSSLYKDSVKKLWKHKKGVVAVGCVFETLNKMNLNNKDVLYLNSYPFPKKIVKSFLDNHQKIEVCELGNEYAAYEINLLSKKENKIISHSIPVDYDITEWHVWDDLEKFFLALKKINPDFVVGDEGTFTDESTKTIQVCLCMGASIAIGIGLSLNGIKYPFVVTGDVSFAHAGMESLLEAAARDVNFGIIILDNDGAKSTGGQKRIVDIYNIPDEVNLEEVRFSEKTQKDFMKILEKMKKRSGVSVLVIRI